MTSLVTIENNKLLVSTLDVAKGFEAEHKHVLELVKKYKDEIKSLSCSAFETRNMKNKNARDTEYFMLNEGQSIFLVSLMKNKKIVVEFKLKLAKDFIKQKATLANISANLQNEEWKQLRANGKITRKQETDTIKEFVEYATNQGSKSAKLYYMNITKMENKALFFLEQKFKNVRDILEHQQLAILSTADQIIEKALIRGMAKHLDYKEIYQIAKENIISFSEIIGKSKIPAIKQLT